LEKIEKVYTSNTEAYKLYQKGRFFWHKRTEEDLNRSIHYFNEALKYDSDFALAYAGLADAYFIEAWWGWFHIPEAIKISKQYAQKALEIDNNLSDVHAVLGGIACWFDCDWQVAEKELKRAIELNPNSAIAHQYYSEFLDVANRREEARKHIDISIDLNPNFQLIYSISAIYYFHSENYKMALEADKKTREFDKNSMPQYWRNFRSYLKLGYDSLAINELVSLTKIKETGSNFRDSLYTLYEKSGMDAIFSWMLNNKNLIFRNQTAPNTALLYLYLNQPEKALEIIEKSYVEGISIYQRINCDPDFNSLRNNPRFVALMKKMNLPIE